MLFLSQVNQKQGWMSLDKWWWFEKNSGSYAVFLLDGYVTWKTVSKLCQKLSKLFLGLSSVESKLNLPPNTCIPRREKITMKRKRRRSREAIDWMEFNSDATKLERDRQYLKKSRGNFWQVKWVTWALCHWHRHSLEYGDIQTYKLFRVFYYIKFYFGGDTHLVTLKTRRRRTHLRTETPSGGITSEFVRTISSMLLTTTNESNRLKRDTK